MKRREVKSSLIENKVRGICLKANTVLRKDVSRAIGRSYGEEKKNTLTKRMLGILIENARIAAKEKLAICQDTGMVTVFIELGENVSVSGIGLVEAVNKGVARAYREGYFRSSVVKDPVTRETAGTNTPAVVHIDLVKGDKIAIEVMPKGFGCENKGRIAMLNPTAGVESIVEFCVDTVKRSGPDACPPYVLGVGIGGTMESCALLAKKALLRPVDSKNTKTHLARIERIVMEKANALNIGVMGIGGKSTVIGVNVEAAPTHISGLPVAVNISCHALRSARVVI